MPAEKAKKNSSKPAARAEAQQRRNGSAPLVAIALARTIRCLAIGMCILFVAIAVAVFALSKADAKMTIHSCDIYAPNTLQALTGALRAGVAFAAREGFQKLIDLPWHMIRYKVLDMPPYYTNEAVEVSCAP